MKAVILENKEGKNLMRLLEAERRKRSNAISCQGNPIDDAHRVFVYVVVQWLQEQGFDL